MDQDYVFETERLKLRKLKLSDQNDLEKILCDKESMKYYKKIFYRKDVRDWIQCNISRYRENGFGLWAVIRKSDNVFIGDAGITIQSIDSEKLPEIGYHIIPRYQRNGYASEAAIGCTKYATEVLGIKRLYSYTWIENIPSQNVMKKIGMKVWKIYKTNDQENIVYSIDI